MKIRLAIPFFTARGRVHWPLLLGALCLAPGCKKKSAGQTQDPQTATQSGSDAQGEPQADAPPPVAQIPDPPQLQEVSHQYWRGDYDALVSELEALIPEWEGPDEQRAAGLAHAWIALAHAEQIPENAQTHVEAALAAAEAIQDAQVLSLAKIASALSLVAMSDAEKAKTLVSDLSAENNEDIAHLLHIARAKTAINLAFDDQDRLAHPEQLDHAAKDYQEIDPHVQADKQAVMGHVYEGLAAIAKFRGDKADVCVQAKKAKEAYKAAKASELLRSGPERMLNTAGCK